MKKLYTSYPVAIKFLRSAENQNKKFIKNRVIGETWEGREIILTTLSFDVDKADEKPALLYTGTIHAREWIGIELALGFIKYYLMYKDIDPRIAQIFSKTTIYIVPCLNPDGFEYSRNHFSFWRKNRRTNADGSFGVDLNRNFSEGWARIKDPSSNVYGGPEPFSEPETQAIKKFVDAHENIAIALDYHSQGNVFFPAHNFKHEDTIDTTDMNILCANMAEEIRKVSGREYGIDQGKPPVKLIGGSGREYYYSKGIIASVVEVGTRNISDYEDDMSEHIREHIPALLQALSEVRNYDHANPLKRPENVQIKELTYKKAELEWEYEIEGDIYFEVYRTVKPKGECMHHTLVGVTRHLYFYDNTVHSSTQYYYFIRAVDKKNRRKSPYSYKLCLKTLPYRDEFYKTLYPLSKETGYLAENSQDNKKHFGSNSLFVGVNKKRGVSIALLTFPLTTTQDNAIIKSAKISVYPTNRVSVTIEKFGEWNMGLLKSNSLDTIYNFNDVYEEKFQDVGTPIKSNGLSQGVWKEWVFSDYQVKHLEKEIDKEKIRFKLTGPTKLKIGRDSQMMQWDIGYGNYGFGLEFRPKLDMVYTIPPIELKLNPYKVYSISKTEVFEKRIKSGFDSEGNRIYAYIEFDLISLPKYSSNVLVNSYIRLLLKELKSKENIRFHIHMINPVKKQELKTLLKSEPIEKIGYDKSVIDIKDEEDLTFVFDSYSIEQIENFWYKKVAFLIMPTSHKAVTKNAVVEWKFKKQGISSNLVVHYIKKRRYPLNDVTKLATTLSNGKIKLTWKNPNHKDFKGVIVVKNPYRIPKSPFDGQKVYGGMDEYTVDTFGATDTEKYYTVFTYDDVPNFSVGVYTLYKKA